MSTVSNYCTQIQNLKIRTMKKKHYIYFVPVFSSACSTVPFYFHIKGQQGPDFEIMSFKYSCFNMMAICIPGPLSF